MISSTSKSQVSNQVDLGGHHGISPKREITLPENVCVVRKFANAQPSTALIAILHTYNKEMTVNQSVVMPLVIDEITK